MNSVYSMFLFRTIYIIQKYGSKRPIWFLTQNCLTKGFLMHIKAFILVKCRPMTSAHPQFGYLQSFLLKADYSLVDRLGYPVYWWQFIGKFSGKAAEEFSQLLTIDPCNPSNILYKLPQNSNSNYKVKLQLGGGGGWWASPAREACRHRSGTQRPLKKFRNFTLLEWNLQWWI